MRRGSRRAALLLAFAALAAGSVGVLGCGDDEDSGDDVTIPEISIPTETAGGSESTTTPPESGGVTPEGDTGGTSPGSGGTGEGSGSGSTTQEDSPSNDRPPAAGSPEAAFEQACKQTPEICQ